MRAFMERLLFPVDSYIMNTAAKERSRILDKAIPAGMIFTMNCPDLFMHEVNYPTIPGANENALKRLFGIVNALCM